MWLNDRLIIQIVFCFGFSFHSVAFKITFFRMPVFLQLKI